jgi:hypothetical protein
VVIGKHVQLDEVRSGGSYLSQNDLRLHFGTGTAKQVDLVEIRWPSGHIDKLEKITTNRLIYVEEGRGVVRSETFRSKR